MIKISVITPSVRPEGLNIVKSALSKQTFTEFEWLIGTPLLPSLSHKAHINAIKYVSDNFRGGMWTLNRIYNKLIKKSQGELIITWQDWIWAKPDALQKFWIAYDDTHGVISGVGDQYERINKFGKPEVKIWSDPRKNNNHGSFYECYPNDCEWNFAAIPKQALYDVGGFDEEMDFRCRGVDAIQVNQRIDELGTYKFYLDQDNESFTVRHDRSVYGGEEAWNNSHGLFNGEADIRKKELISKGLWPRLNYLI